MKVIVRILLLIVFVAQSSLAQIHNFRFYGVNEGLSQSQVSSICQDKNGYIWMGTQGGGLNRFDGKKFVVYSMQEGLNSNIIWKIFCDSKGNLWIGTSSGLSKYNGKKFETIATPFNISDKDVWDITEDKKGNIWIATGGYGVISFDGSRYVKYGINDGLGFSHANKIYCDIKGHIWVGSYGYGLARYRGEVFENVTDRLGLPITSVDEITETSDDQLLVFGEKSAHVLNGDRFQIQGYSELLRDNVNSAKKDSKGNIWIATTQSGIFRLGSNSQLHFAEENGLPGTSPLCVFIDDKENAWFGFDGSGSALFIDDRFVHYTKQNGLPNSVVKSFIQDQEGHIWIGTEKGVALYAGKQFATISSEDGLSSDNVHSMFQSEDNSIWFGTDEGPCRYHNSKIECFPESPKGTIGAVFCFFQDPATGEILIGSDEGVLTYTGNGFDHRYTDSLPPMRVFNIRLLGRDDLWICGDKGAFRFNGHSFVHVPLRDEYGKLDAMDCWKDPRGNVWIITSRGIVKRKKDESFENIKKKHGLSSDNLYLMLFDGEALWIGSDHGLDKIIPDSDWDIKEIRHYGRAEGFTGLECNASAALKDNKGKLWFGTVKGATSYDPKQDLINSHVPSLMFTGMRLLYEATDWQSKYPETTITNGLPEGIVLNHEDNHITFDFIGLEYSNPEKVRYQFMLEGFDEGWSPETYENSATYTNLPAGEFRFAVKACNNDGFWSEPIYYSFGVDAPFWKKKWFYALLLPLVVILFYIVLLLRTRKLNRAKRLLEEKVRQRTSELNRQKDEMEKLSIVASKMNEGVLICGPDGEIEWINDSFYRMAGHTEESFSESIYGRAKTLQEMSSYPDIENAVRNFKNNKEPVLFDSSHFSKDGMVIWTRSSIVPVYNNNGDLSKIITIYTDITDRKNVELALEQSNRDFLDSVKYARRIQEAILPSLSVLERHFNQSFVFYKPRDIVSGDFYWFSKVNDVFLWAVADCTGHGVPGAFMSLIGNEFLHQIANNAFVTGPEQCLHLLDKQVTRALRQEGEDRESRDGMDIGLCSIHLDTMLCQFSGANIPMYLIRNGEVMEQDAEKESIGGFNERGKDFYSHEFPLLPGDMLYMTTDGFIDQFGGENGKKFMRRRFKETILKIHTLPVDEQMQLLEEEFSLWKGDRKQIDDVLVIGIRIP